jgi:hypothetical protein
MKKITFFAILFFAAISSVKAQTVFYTETFGTPALDSPVVTVGESKNELLQNHVWDTNIVTYSWTLVDNADPLLPGTINVRNNNPSTYVGASGVGNLYFNANAINSFTITGNTNGFSNVKLSFGIFGKAAGDSKKMVVEYSLDGGTQFVPIAATEIAALTSAAKGWELISNISFPTATSVKLKFSTPNLGEIRIDDVKLAGTGISAIPQFNNDNQKLTVSNATINLEGFNTGNVEIFNLQGKKVFTSEIVKTLQPKLQKGLYIVKIGDFKQKITW